VAEEVSSACYGQEAGVQIYRCHSHKAVAAITMNKSKKKKNTIIISWLKPRGLDMTRSCRAASASEMAEWFLGLQCGMRGLPNSGIFTPRKVSWFLSSTRSDLNRLIQLRALETAELKEKSLRRDCKHFPRQHDSPQP
jgi:hypothetical protein